MKNELTRQMLEDSAGSTQASQIDDPTQSGGQAPQPGQDKNQPTPYTDEEVSQLLESDGKIDANRLTPVQKAIQKTFEKHYQKRYQQLASERREAAQPQQYGPMNVYQQFDQNPQAVMGNLRAMIAQAKKEDPFSDKVIQLEMLRDDLNERRIVGSQMEIQASRAINDTLTQARDLIPNLEKKKPLLEEFAREQYGYSDQELLYFTDPTIHGMGPVLKFIKTVNDAYDRANPGKGKEVKLSPNQLERASTPAPEDKGGDPATWSYTKYKAEREAGRLK